MSGIRQLQLPADLCDAVQQRFGLNFDSTEKILTFVLQELLRDEGIPMDEREREIIERRLKDLGYV